MAGNFVSGVNTAYHGTLSGTSEDRVTFAVDIDGIEVLNYSGGSDIWFTVTRGAAGPVPAPNLVDTYRVAAGQALTVPLATAGENETFAATVRLVGSSNSYSVTAV